MTARRKYLAGVLGVTGLSGCLRLTGSNENSGNQAETTDASTRQDRTTSQQDRSSGSGDSYRVERFSLNFIDADGSLEGETAQIQDAQSGDFLDIDVSWDGSREVFSNQAAARYSFEVVQEGTTLARTGERILILGYQFGVQQTQDSLFVTYQPSIRDSWRYEVKLFNPTNEYTATPEIRPDDGVFELPFEDAGIEDGSYNWTLNITPTDGGEETGPTINLGTFEESLIAVGAETDMPNRDETIEYVGQFADSEAVSVEPPQNSNSDGLTISDGGGHSGTNGPQRSEFLSQSFQVRCQPDPIEIGGGTGRRFRINNSTTGDSLDVVPR
jgi:hypothetical protein